MFDGFPSLALRPLRPVCNGVLVCLLVQFAAIKDVAEFVGSPLSDKELCCIATEGSQDMGSHTVSRRDRGQITSRFGKWKVQYYGGPYIVGIT